MANQEKKKIHNKVFDLMNQVKAKDNVDIISDEIDVEEQEVEKPDKKPFNPHGSDYDKETANELNQLYPLTIPYPERPGKYDEETISQESAVEAWVWHKSEKKWVRHGPTLDPRPKKILVDGKEVEARMFLKGMAKDAPKGSRAHESMRKGIEAEERLGSKVIFYEPHGRYYSISKNQLDEYKQPERK